MDIAKINLNLNSEPKFNLRDRYLVKKNKQTSISDFVNWLWRTRRSWYSSRRRLFRTIFSVAVFHIF